MWRDKYPLLDAAHAPELESRAAVLELKDGVPPREAEAQAHRAYVRDHATRAAAHHLAGIRAAHAAGDMENAARHGLRYGVMARALGHDAQGEPPPEIARMARDPELSRVYRFAPHAADAMLLTHLLAQRSSMRKSEDDEATSPPPPVGGTLLGDRSTPGRAAWDLSHVLPQMRRDHGERLVVLEGPQGRTAHLVRDEAGRRVPLHALAEADGGPTGIGGEPPDDVRRAADLAFRLRRGAAAAAIADRVRQAAGVVSDARLA